MVTPKERETKKTERVKQTTTFPVREGTQKQATAIGKKIEPFIPVVAPQQSGDKGKKKTSLPSLSKKGKGSGPRGKY